MKLRLILFISFFLLQISVNSYAQDTDSPLDVTLYYNDFSIIHDQRTLDIHQGTTEVGINHLPREIMAETIFADFDGRILNQSYSYQETFGPERIYKNLVDTSIRLVNENGELVEGILRSHEHGQLWLEDENKEFIFIQNAYNYRLHTDVNPDVLTSLPRVIWTVESEEGGQQDVSIYYQVRSLGWTMDYNLILSEDQELMNFEGKATIVNRSGLDYKNARIRLVAGDINVQPRQKDSWPEMDTQQMMRMATSGVMPERMFEYHVFELPNQTTLSDQEQKQITLQTASEIEARKHYQYQTGSFGQSGRNSNNNVNVELRLTNSEEFKLGTPLTEGIVKVYQKQGELREFIGEDRIEHTPVDQDFIISVGQAFDIVVEEKQVRLAELSNRVREEDREITITNQKEQDVTIEVELRLNQNEELLESTIQAIEEEATRFKFNVPVEPESETTLLLKMRRSN